MVVPNIDVVLKSVLRSYIHSLGKYETKRNCKCWTCILCSGTRKRCISIRSTVWN